MPSPALSFDSPTGPEVRINGRSYLHFGGTGYLDIQRRPELRDAADRAMRHYGFHPATSRLGFGDTPPMREAEAEAAQFFGTEAAWLLPSGWMGAAVLAGAHVRAQDRIYLDRHGHYALRDAARLTGQPLHEFEHLDAASLRAVIRATLAPGERPVVLSDGVFAVTGRIAPLADYLAVLDEYPDARLLVDDAHGFGVLGRHGHGTAEHLQLTAEPRLLVTGTVSKALGGYGGVLLGSSAEIVRVQASSALHAGTTPLPTPVAAATGAALRIARLEPDLRQRLAANITTLRAGLRGLGLPVEDFPTPMIPLVLPDGLAMQRLQDSLRADGVLVPYLPRYAGLGPHGALRIAALATHTPAQLQHLLDALRRHL